MAEGRPFMPGCSADVSKRQERDAFLGEKGQVFRIAFRYTACIFQRRLTLKRIASRICETSRSALILAIGVSTTLVTAQTSTRDQIELWEALSESEREAVLKRMESGQEGLDQGLELPELVEPVEIEEEDVEEPPRLASGDTVVVEFEAELETLDTATPPERQEAAEFLERLRAGNPYQLDKLGFLQLPRLAAIYLAGLEVEQATIRLNAEPALAGIEVTLILLPLDPRGLDALEKFGYDLFEGVPSTFAPVSDVPVPTDYVIGPGDAVSVHLFGNKDAEYHLVVNRDGLINFPEIGPISVVGLSFESMRSEIALRLNEQMIGVHASITLGALRSIRVFILGDVVRPGSYTVSGLSTMTNALFSSGGVEEIGSLRRIELRRDGETVSTLDLYDLLLRGDTRGDAPLKPNDVIFVPPVGDTVAVDGEVKRPAIYEIRGEASVAEVLALAGGIRATANPAAIKIQRVEPGKGTSVRDIELGGTRSEIIKDGDFVQVLPNLDQLHGSVRLSGNVQQPGIYEWNPEMRLTDLLPSAEAMRSGSDLRYVLIRREVEPNVLIEVVSSDLEAAWRMPRSEADIELAPRDTVHVFDLEIGRGYFIETLIEELRIQAGSDESIPTAWVVGQVREPGVYPIEAEMRVSDLIRAGGGLRDSAYRIDAELTRNQVVGGEFRDMKVIPIDLAGILRGNATADLAISPYDHLIIKEIPFWRELATVELEGKVVFPGLYRMKKGEKLSQLLRRAGGLTEDAFPEGSVFLREELRLREEKNIERAVSRIESDLLSTSLTGEGAMEKIRIGQALVEKVRSTEPSGRLVIDLVGLLSGDTDKDILLKDGDQLLVPEFAQEVSVIGEVQYTASHLYDASLRRHDYIAKSGGLSNRADKKRIYIVRANGDVSIQAAANRRIFNRKTIRTAIRPGDTIVVPLDTRRIEPIVFWTSITQMVYQLGIAAAAISSF